MKTWMSSYSTVYIMSCICIWMETRIKDVQNCYPLKMGMVWNISSSTVRNDCSLFQELKKRSKERGRERDWEGERDRDRETETQRERQREREREREDQTNFNLSILPFLRMQMFTRVKKLHKAMDLGWWD